MDDFETRPQHYFYPVLILIIGGLFTLWTPLAWIGWLIVGVGVACTAFLTLNGIKTQEIRKIKENQFLYAEIRRLDDALRVKNGGQAAADTVKVIIDKTSITGATFSQSYRKAPIEPWKMKSIAQACLNGRPFAIREWTPLKEGKLLSDTEWRHLVDFLRQPDPDTPDIKFIVLKNADNYREGYEWTSDGLKFLEAVAADVNVNV